MRPSSSHCAPRLGCRELGLDLVVLDQASLRPCRRGTSCRGAGGPCARCGTGRAPEHADLAREHHETVVGDEVATGAQAVAVERRADERAVGEDEGGGAVPRLHEHRVVLVERAAGRVDVDLVLVRLRHHHHHRVRQAAAREVEQLHDLVERRGVARAGGVDRQDRLDVAEQLALELGLAGAHPVAVALHRVDLAVVRDHAERLGERPRRERVGRVARVHEGELRREALVAQVGVERLELQRRDHALVDERAARQRREVHVQLALCALAQAEHLALEREAADDASPCVAERVDCRNSCSNVGIAPRARSPTWSGRTGTSRQPSTVRCSSAARAAMPALTSSRSAASLERNAMPTA